jgi:nitrite reductase/ring-hydroxylating ferredoxin subunit
VQDQTDTRLLSLRLPVTHNELMTMTDRPDPRRAPARWLLPPEAYLSQEWFEREQELLFERCWAFAGMTDDLPHAGDYTTITVGRQPLVVVRTPEGRLYAFHNLCRHRGAKLLEGRGNVQRGISCFYHRWRYDLDGRLTTVPQSDQFPDLCKEDWGLKPAAVDSWNGLLFVHVDPEPDQSLETWLGAFPDRMGAYKPLGPPRCAPFATRSTPTGSYSSRPRRRVPPLAPARKKHQGPRPPPTGLGGHRPALELL